LWFARTALLLCFLCSSVLSQTTEGAKADAESLLNEALPFAKQMLQKHGEFYPYGMAMQPDGKVSAVAVTNGSDHPQSAEVIADLKKAFIDGARAKKYKATALVYDARVVVPKAGSKSDAIAVSLDHRDGYSVVVYFPYRVDHSVLALDDAFASAVRRAFSRPCNRSAQRREGRNRSAFEASTPGRQSDV
jgi:hypothetical protein